MHGADSFTKCVQRLRKRDAGDSGAILNQPAAKIQKVGRMVAPPSQFTLRYANGTSDDHLAASTFSAGGLATSYKPNGATIFKMPDCTLTIYVYTGTIIIQCKPGLFERQRRK